MWHKGTQIPETSLWAPWGSLLDSCSHVNLDPHLLPKPALRALHGLGPVHSPYPHICTNIRKVTLNHLSSLAPDPGELGDFSPKGHGAHGPMPIALPFGCEGTHPWGPSRVWSRHLLVLQNIPEGPSVTAATEPFTDAGRSCDSLQLPTHSTARNILRALKS